MNWEKIGKGLLIAMAGAGLTYVAQIQWDFGTWTPVAVAVASAFVNAGKVWLQGK